MSTKVSLICHLFTLQMGEGASVADHLNEFNIITTQLSSIGIEFDDEIRALLMLSSLLKSWSKTITVVTCALVSNEKVE